MLSAPLVHGAYQGEPSFEPGALLVMDFVRGRYRRGPGRGRVASDPAGVSGWQSVGHAGFGRTRVNGAYPPFAPDAPLIGDGGLGVWEARTNSIRNPVMAGAAVGTPGTFPTHWGGAVLSSGLNRQIVGIGVENDLPFLDVRIFGSLAAAGDALVLFDNASSIAASNGQTWTSHGHVSLVAGALVAGVFHRQEYRDSGGNFLLSTNVGASFLLDATLREHRRSRTIATANTAFIRSGLYIFFPAAGDVDFTIRIAAPNLKLGPDINDPPILQESGLPATRTAVAQSVGGLVLPPVFTVIAEADIPHAPDGLGAHTLVSGGSTFSDCWSLTRRDVSGGWQAFVRAGGVTQFDVIFGLLFSGPVKMAARIEANNFRVAMNGTLSGLDTNGSVPTTSNVRFGSSSWAGAGSDALNGVVSRVSILPFGAPDAQLQALTA